MSNKTRRTTVALPASVQFALALIIALGSSASSALVTAELIESAADETTNTQAETTTDGHESRTDGSGEGDTGVRETERPHIRQDQREEMRQENAEAERLGERIMQLTEDEEVDFAAAKAQAEADLFRASQTFTEQEHAMEGEGSPEERGAPAFDGNDMHAGPGPGEQQRVCYRDDGTITPNREECDPNQGRHLGMTTANAPGADAVSQHMGQKFASDAPPSISGDNVIFIVGEALERLSGMVTNMQGNPQALAEIQGTMSWLSGILKKHGSGEIPPEQAATLAQEMSSRLSSIASMTSTSTGGGHMGGFGRSMEDILPMMRTMLGKLDGVFAILDKHGLTPPPGTREAAAEAQALFEKISSSGDYGDLEQVIQILMDGMRDPMMTMFATAGPKAMEAGMEIQKLMEGDMPQQMGPPQGNFPQGNHPQGNYQQGDYPQGYGPPPGMHDGQGAPGSYGSMPDQY